MKTRIEGLRQKTAEETKLFTDLQTVEDFVSYYRGATKAELKNRLKALKHPKSKSRRNERDAIIYMLA